MMAKLISSSIDIVEFLVHRKVFLELLLSEAGL